MKTSEIINQVPFQVVLMKYFETYLTMYGEKKFKDIADKINESSNVKKVIKWASGIDRSPSSKEFFEEVHLIPYFYFSGAETHITGALVLLAKWYAEVGEHKSLFTDKELNETIFLILEKGENLKVFSKNTQSSFFNVYRKNLDAFINSAEYKEIAPQLFIDNRAKVEIDPIEAMFVLKYGAGSVGEFATTYFNVYDSNLLRYSNEESLKNVLSQYSDARKFMNLSSFDHELLFRNSNANIEKLIFCMLCEDKDYILALSSDTPVAPMAIEAIYERISELSLGRLRTTKEEYFNWTNEYLIEKLKPKVDWDLPSGKTSAFKDSITNQYNSVHPERVKYGLPISGDAEAIGERMAAMLAAKAAAAQAAPALQVDNTGQKDSITNEATAVHAERVKFGLPTAGEIEDVAERVAAMLAKEAAAAQLDKTLEAEPMYLSKNENNYTNKEEFGIVNQAKLNSLNQLFDIAASHQQFYKLKYAVCEYFCGFGHIETCAWNATERDEKLWENFNNRFNVTFGTLLLAIINFKFSDSKVLTPSELQQYNQLILKGLLELRKEVMKAPIDRKFSFDTEPLFHNVDSKLMQSYFTVIKSIVLELENAEGYHSYKIVNSLFSQLGVILPEIDNYDEGLFHAIDFTIRESVKVIVELVSVIKQTIR